MEAQRKNINSSKKISDELLKELEQNAAEVLYEMANGITSVSDCSSSGEGSRGDNTEDQKAVIPYVPSTNDKGKRKLLEYGSSSRSNKKLKHYDQSDFNVQGLCNKAISLGTGEGKLIIGNPSQGSSPDVALVNSAEFPFSIIHLLSAVRATLVTPLPQQKNLPSLTIDQIVERLRCKPGDPRVLECSEPIIELVRGVLKIFSSGEMVPLGSIFRAPLTTHDKLRKHWRWTGPLPYGLSHENCTTVDISSSAWGLSQENLIKLVSQFSLWLRKMQPTLQLVSTLPSPPLQLMQSRNFGKRFNGREKLNQDTIGRSCEEIRDYFRREEVIRYLIPDKSFKYTTLNGEKAAVAPLRMSSDKGLKRSRGHHIFKENRPPQFTLLSLVRDAAARLPGGLGTRTDICTLVRDSQYIIDDVSDKDIKLIVSGALDRLHGQVDPCVEYNTQWGLWTYLHANREEEDFKENGTSMKPKKDKENTKSS